LDLIISSQELYKLIKSQDNILIINTSPFLEYKNGHIPGAVNIDLFQLHWFDMTKRGIKDFDRQCKLMLSKLGIKQDNKVIFYENVSGITASRGVWMVMYFFKIHARWMDDLKNGKDRNYLKK
jgi:thiosulfate/3-mercaptopyruvate sulfurtransferase